MNAKGDEMKFLGRKKECGVLEQMYQRNDFQMLILYGRRRVGKTTLLNRFSEGKDPLFFTGIESKDEENLQEFGREVFAHFHEETPGVSFRSWSDLFSFLTSCLRKKSSKKKELIIIDEYPYIAENAEELSSLLQRAIDREWSRMNVMLVLCGSSITFMEEEVLGEKSPLYGRRTGQIDLLPFDYLTSAEFVPGYRPEEKALVYGMTGGIPKYLAMFRDDISVDQNIISLFFSPSGYFYEEPKNLLRQEFRDISLYYAIVNAIASGSCQVSEIAGKSGFDTPKVVQALKKLEAVRIVRKETPILNEKNKKLNQYVLQDGMFRFWFRFVSKGISMIERNYGESYYRAAVQPLLHEFMGPAFEEICREYIMRKGAEGAFGSMITRVGKWRGSDPFRKCPSDIDVVGISDLDKTAVIGECKFRSMSIGKEEYETLHDRGRLIAPWRVTHYFLFSLGGFTAWVREKADEDSGTELVPIEKLYEPRE